MAPARTTRGSIGWSDAPTVGSAVARCIVALLCGRQAHPIQYGLERRTVGRAIHICSHTQCDRPELADDPPVHLCST